MAKVDTQELALVIWSALSESVSKLAAAGSVAIPEQAESLQAIAGCLSSRNGTWRRSKPTSDDSAALLWQLVKFHRGNGSLWGFPWFADEEQRDRLDTLAILLLGNKSSAANAWKRAIYG